MGNSHVNSEMLGPGPLMVAVRARKTADWG